MFWGDRHAKRFRWNDPGIWDRKKQCWICRIGGDDDDDDDDEDDDEDDDDDDDDDEDDDEDDDDDDDDDDEDDEDGDGDDHMMRWTLRTTRRRMRKTDPKTWKHTQSASLRSRNLHMDRSKGAILFLEIYRKNAGRVWEHLD